MIPLTNIESEIIQEAYDNNKKYLTRIGIIATIVLSFMIFVPLDFFGRARRSGISGSLTDSLGVLPAFIVVAIVVAILLMLFYFVFNMHNLRKDINHQEKVAAKVMVQRIERLGADIAAATEGNKDTLLHFDSNPENIKEFIFNRKSHPEYLEAKAMIIERAKYSKIEFKTKIVEETET